MLEIIVPSCELWDEEKEEYIYMPEQVLQLEHSLVSLSKWESKWCKPFLYQKEKSYEETVDYIKCMTLNKNINSFVYYSLTMDNFDEINKYINAPMTATTFSDDKNSKPNREIITSEIIYYWMIALGIPFECKKWHLNKLLTLIRVCNIKNQPPKKMGKRELMSRNAALNAARKKLMNTRG